MKKFPAASPPKKVKVKNKREKGKKTKGLFPNTAHTDKEATDAWTKPGTV
jgi:hypothetical protein